jgi:site-specific recombinase XerD
MKIKYFTQEERQAFFEAIGSTRDRLLFRWLWEYGLRVAEATDIRLSALKPNEKHPLDIFIKRKKDGVSRTYPLSVPGEKLLRKWLAERSKLKNAEGNEFLFITNKSGIGAMSNILITKLNEKYAEQAKVSSDKWSNPHAWRHTCGVHLALQGKDAVFIQHWLGHHSLEMTNIYLQIGAPEWEKLSKGAIELFEE